MLLCRMRASCLNGIFKTVLEIQNANPVSFLNLGALVVFKLAGPSLVPWGGDAPRPALNQGQEIQLVAEKCPLVVEEERPRTWP